jgi:hypothetical protein
MQLLILFFPALLLYVLAYHLLVPMLTYCADVIASRPKLPSPQLLLHLRAGGKYFSRRYTLDRLHYLLRAIDRHTLHQEVNMVFVCPDLQERDFISLTDLQTDLFEFEVYFRAKHHSSVLRRANYMIEKYRNVMALMNEATHSYSIISQQAAGNLPRRDKSIGDLRD